MKAALFAAALMLGGAAVAQTQAPPAGGTTIAPSNQNPERDARGIPVISEAAVAPAGFNQAPRVGGTGADPSQPPAPMPAATDLPPCSRTVTDRCVQTYERGVRPR